MLTTTDPLVERARTGRGRLAALVVVAGLVAAACGGGGGAEPAAGQPNGDDQDTSTTTGRDPDGSDDAAGSGGSAGRTAALDSWALDEPNVVQPTPGEVRFDATFSDDTSVVSRDAVVEVGDDHTYVLDTAMLDATGGRPERGSVLLIPGTALRRVTAVEESGGQLRVTTEFASLTDAIVDGDIEWDVALPASALFQTDPDTTPIDVPVRAVLPAGGGSIVPVGAGVVLPDGTHQQVAWQVTQNDELPLRWTYADGHNEYLFALGVTDEDLDVMVQVKRDLGGRTALAYTATGKIGVPRTSGDVRIRGGNLEAASIDQRGLGGRVELTIAAAGAGKAPVDFELPGLWFKYIVPIGPIPLTFGITARVIGDIEVPAEASAQATAVYTFGGDMGFQLSGGSVDASVTMPDLGIVPQPADSAAMIGNYVNAEFGLAFPSMSVSLFDQGVIPRIYPGMILGSRLQWGPVCKTAYVDLVVQGSYDFKILGVNLLSGERIDLIEPQRTEARGDSCPAE